MRLTGIFISEASGKSESGAYIILESEDNVIVGSLLCTTYEDKVRYFEVKGVAFIPELGKVTITAKQKGYYNMIMKDKEFNIIDFYQSTSYFELITDQEIIKKVNQESQYC